MKLNRTVLLGSQLYGPGDEEKLLAKLPAKDVQRLAAKGYLVADVEPEVAPEPEPKAATAPKRTRRKPAAKKAAATKSTAK